MIERMVGVFENTLTFMRQHIDDLSEKLPDDQRNEDMPAMGHILMQVVVGHMAYHAGQLAAWRYCIPAHERIP